MTTTLIITLCVLLLLAYVFDLSSKITKIPSVILLLLLGWITRQITDNLGTSIPDMEPMLPVLGTVGLILIVLEGSLELELDKRKLPVVAKTSLISFMQLMIKSVLIAMLFYFISDTSFKNAFANAVPLAIVSSAIAIPSAQHLSMKKKEFIIYESSLSDIFGVIVFNFVSLNETISASTFGWFFLELLLIVVITLIATVGLTMLLGTIKHRIKFLPIILIIILIYAIAKVYHLSGLVFILFFGLFLGNLEEIKQLKFLKKFNPDMLKHEVHKFRELTGEIAFLIRSLFFLLFGYLINARELMNTNALLLSLGVVLIIYGTRYLILRIFKISLESVLFISPRGLITILLFLSLPVSQHIDVLNKSVILQVIIITSIVLLAGMPKKKSSDEISQ